ncbi:hypothetical protein D3C80_1002210 [compost metagenome]
MQQVAQHADTHRLRHTVSGKRAHLAQAYDQGTAPGLAQLFFARSWHQDHRGIAQFAGMQAQALAMAERAIDQGLVDDRLGAGNRVAAVMPADHRDLDEAEVHGLDHDLQHAALAAAQDAAATAEHATDQLLVGGIQRRPTAVADQRRALFLTPADRQAPQGIGHAFTQQCLDIAEIFD